MVSLRLRPWGEVVGLVVAAAVTVDPSLRGARSDRCAEPRGPRAPEIAWKLPYKSDGIGYLLRREIHLFRVPVEGDQVEQLTDGPFDVLSHAISPDGRQIAFQRRAPGNLVQPGTGAIGIFERVIGPVGLDEGILHRLVRVGGVAQIVQRDPRGAPRKGPRLDDARPRDQHVWRADADR